MRQYGAPAGNPWESDSDIVAAQARTVEDRIAKELIEEHMASVPSEPELRVYPSSGHIHVPCDALLEGGRVCYLDVGHQGLCQCCEDLEEPV